MLIYYATLCSNKLIPNIEGEGFKMKVKFNSLSYLFIPPSDSVDGISSSSSSTTSANDNRLSKLNESQLLAKGAACDLLYLGGVKVDNLTGDGAVQYAMNKVTSLAAQLKTTIVNIKVNQEGITLTDNNRRLVITDSCSCLSYFKISPIFTLESLI